MKELADSRAALLACMKEAKVLIDGAFAKGGVDLSDALPDADPVSFSDWLSMEHGQFDQLLSGMLDIGAYGAAVSLARMFQELSCDHMKAVTRPPHKFPKVDDVRGAINDDLCKNVVSRFLKRFWEKGGRTLALEISIAGTREVIFET